MDLESTIVLDICQGHCFVKRNAKVLGDLQPSSSSPTQPSAKHANEGLKWDARLSWAFLGRLINMGCRKMASAITRWGRGMSRSHRMQFLLSTAQCC